MKRSVLAILFSMTLCGCATFGTQDRQVLLQQKVSASLYEKMLRNQSLTLGEIVELSRKNVPSPVIVRYVDGTLEEYPLKTEDVIRLRREGVTNEVIDYLLTTPSLTVDQAFVRDRYWWDRTYRPILVYPRRGR